MNTRLFLGIAGAALGLAGLGPAHAQLSIHVSSDEDPYGLCSMGFEDQVGRWGTGIFKNNKQARNRFRYHAGEYGKKLGRKVWTDCITHKNTNITGVHSPGYSFTSQSGHQITVQEITFLPPNWENTPVPGEEPQQQAADGALRTTMVRWPVRRDVSDGYEDAQADLKYRFIACFGEIHVAYALVPDSVKTSATYVMGRKPLDAGVVPPPKLSSVSLKARVVARDMEFGPWKTIDYINDKNAGPALGMGCFTGQTKKVGAVKDYFASNATPQQMQAHLDKNFELTDAFVDTESRLRNMELERITNAEWDRMGVDRALRQNDAYYAEIKAKLDAQTAARKAAIQRYEQQTAAAKAAQEKFARDKAAHEAELARAKAQEEAYRRQRAAYEAEYERVTGKKPPQ
jgi:hypothetical protein